MMSVIAKSCGITKAQARARFGEAWRRHQADIASLIAEGYPAEVVHQMAPFYWVAPSLVTFYYVLGGKYGTSPRSQKARLYATPAEAQSEVELYTMLDRGRIRELLKPKHPSK